MSNKTRQRKNKERIYKAMLKMAVFAFSLLILYSAGHYAISLWHKSAQQEGSPLSFSPETYSTNMPEMKPVLDPFFDSLKGMVLSSTGSAALCQGFMENHKEFKSIKLIPNYFTGDVNIRFVPRKAVAEADISGKKAYIADDGTIMDRNAGEIESLPFNVFLSSNNISGNLPRFLVQLAKSHDIFAKPLREVSCGEGENSCVLKLEDGTKINWGTIFYTSRKIEELNHILAVAGSRQSGAYSYLDIDMRYCVSLGRSYYKTVSGKTAKEKNS
ncbi:MAG: hypothetical protein K5838_08760 [Elusimicrobiales bacterium]|nr:hypothetical protein [Elusimicrobiales bacterium]